MSDIATDNIRLMVDEKRIHPEDAKVGRTYYRSANQIPMDLEHAMNYAAYCDSRHVSLTNLFEQLNPTDPNNREHANSDAFERMLRRFNIRTKSDAMRGIPASTMADFINPPARLDNGQADERTRATAPGMFQSQDPQSWIMFPEYINRQLRILPLMQDVLGEVVAKVTPIDSMAYKTIYLDDTRDQRRMSRVPERGEFPTVYLQTKEHDVVIEKYGLKLEGSYEYARRVRLDIFSLFLQRIAAQNRLDQAETAIDILINGDGNGNAAPNWTVTTLDANAGSGPGTVYDTYLALYGYPNQSSTITKAMTYNAFLKYKATMLPMNMSTILGRLNELLQIITLQFPNINPLLLLAQFNAEGVKMGTVELAQDIWSTTRLVYFPFMVGGLLVGLDKNLAIEELVEINSNITEMARNVNNQTQFIIMSQNIGFNKIINEACLTLTYA